MSMNAAQQARLDQLLEENFPQDRFIETATKNTILVECTCGWKQRVRKRNSEARKATVRAIKNIHLTDKH